ncbi:MAG: SIS domain-containing protein [Thermoguttaceae bacterium]|jgi:D-sedoheptulose 7-phosphate isomerase|nr:SIS domain-containing protein [Thermoguttaceae bacterium]
MIGIDLPLDDYLAELKRVLDLTDRGEMVRMADLLFEAYERGGQVFVCGNGGSAALASHIAEDVGKGTLREADLRDEDRPRFRILSLTDNAPWITALANDVGYDQVFVQQLMHYGRPGDLLVAISGSGNSPNVIAAVEWANRHGLTTFGMTGFDGGKLRRLQTAGVHVPIDDMGMTESVHGCILTGWSTICTRA